MEGMTLRRVTRTGAALALLAVGLVPAVAYADGPEDGVVQAQIFNPGLSGYEAAATGGGAASIPGVAGSGVVKSEVFNPARSGLEVAATGGGAASIPGVAGSGVVRSQVFNPGLSGGEAPPELLVSGWANLALEDMSEEMAEMGGADGGVVLSQLSNLEAAPAAQPAGPAAMASAAEETGGVMAGTPSALPAAGGPILPAALLSLLGLGGAAGGLWMRRRR